MCVPASGAGLPWPRLPAWCPIRDAAGEWARDPEPASGFTMYIPCAAWSREHMVAERRGRTITVLAPPALGLPAGGGCYHRPPTCASTAGGFASRKGSCCIGIIATRRSRWSRKHGSHSGSVPAR